MPELYNIYINPHTSVRVTFVDRSENECFWWLIADLWGTLVEKFELERPERFFPPADFAKDAQLNNFQSGISIQRGKFLSY